MSAGLKHNDGAFKALTLEALSARSGEPWVKKTRYSVLYLDFAQDPRIYKLSGVLFMQFLVLLDTAAAPDIQNLSSEIQATRGTLVAFIPNNALHVLFDRSKLEELQKLQGKTVKLLPAATPSLC